MFITKLLELKQLSDACFLPLRKIKYEPKQENTLLFFGGFPNKGDFKRYFVISDMMSKQKFFLMPIIRVFCYNSTLLPNHPLLVLCYLRYCKLFCNMFFRAVFTSLFFRLQTRGFTRGVTTLYCMEKTNSHGEPEVGMRQRRKPEP